MAQVVEGIKLKFHKKQSLLYNSKATEILYGGAAGGGKSYGMRGIAIDYCTRIPGLQVYLFRRLFDDLRKNHVTGTGGFNELLGPLEALKVVKMTEDRIKFANGSIIYLCHCQHPDDVKKYQGAEIHLLLIDELTHFEESIYRYLRARVRVGGLKIPEGFTGIVPRIILSSNPGGVGHTWVKSMFIDKCEPYKLYQMPDVEGKMIRQFIPALLQDNPTLNENDPDYKSRLMALGTPDLVKAMLEGNWDITGGAAFEKLSRDTHMIRNIRPPETWTKFMAMDWGTYRPFSVGWYCVVDDDYELPGKDGFPDMLIPKGSLIRYRELYGWNGRPNEGNRMESFEVARQILEIEDEAEDEMDYRVVDSGMYSSQDGPSPIERMYEKTGGRFRCQPAMKDRAANYMEVRSRIAGEDGLPLLYVTVGCKHFWRTVPTLQLDEYRPEKGPDSSQEDHVYDELQYACASRPQIKKKKLKTWDDPVIKRGGRSRYATH